MDSKLRAKTNTPQCQVSIRQRGCHTDSIVYAVKDCRSDGKKKTSKRNLDESLPRPSEDVRTSTSVIIIISDEDEGNKSRETPNSPEVLSYQATTEASFSNSDESLLRSNKRRRTCLSSSSSSEDIATFPSVYNGPPESSAEDVRTSTPVIIIISDEEEGKKKRKRKAEETERPKKRSKKTSSPSKTTTEASSSNKPGTSLSATTAPPGSRAAFKMKYREEKLLGEGGFGSVFAGYRKDDNLPVAIKHIRQRNIKHTSILLDGKSSMVPLEVALMLKLKPVATGTSAAINLLDWYNLSDELILILERPVPCMDLIDYLDFKSGLQEHEAKIIVKQLVDALINVHSRGVFHRDIKMDNVLIETSSDVPRIRIIDFGAGDFLEDRTYTTRLGADLSSSPEWFLHRRYRAEPATVWQLGILMYGILHRELPFYNLGDIVCEDPCIKESLSFNCRDFLLSCLDKCPEARSTLEALKNHSWLM